MWEGVSGERGGLPKVVTGDRRLSVSTRGLLYVKREEYTIWRADRTKVV